MQTPRDSVSPVCKCQLEWFGDLEQQGWTPVDTFYSILFISDTVKATWYKTGFGIHIMAQLMNKSVCWLLLPPTPFAITALSITGASQSLRTSSNQNVSLLNFKLAPRPSISQLVLQLLPPTNGPVGPLVYPAYVC